MYIILKLLIGFSDSDPESLFLSCILIWIWLTSLLIASNSMTCALLIPIPVTAPLSSHGTSPAGIKASRTPTSRRDTAVIFGKQQLSGTSWQRGCFIEACWGAAVRWPLPWQSDDGKWCSCRAQPACRMKALPAASFVGINIATQKREEGDLEKGTYN